MQGGTDAGLPWGEVLPMLERFERIYLWMDDDPVGIEASRKFAAKLGQGRCLLVSPGTAKDVLPPGACPCQPSPVWV